MRRLRAWVGEDVLEAREELRDIAAVEGCSSVQVAV